MIKNQNTTITVMEKTIYSAPLTEILDIGTEGALLTNSVQSVEIMDDVHGTWDAEE